jgi:hypothetical protein
MPPDTRTPEQIEVDRELLIHIGKAEELVKRREALKGRPVTASSNAAAPHAARMAAARGRTAPSPDRQPIASRVAITAAASSARIAPGSTLTNRDELAEVTVETLRQMQADPEHYGRKHTVARAVWEYPAERRLSHDAMITDSRIEAVCGLEALVASGGVCLPVNVDYSVPTWATAERPLRDGLPAFQADRGGIRFVTPPDIGVPSLQATASGLGAATGIWTEATDASPAGQTKPVFQVQCGTEQLVYVNAIPTRVGFGNMQGRFAPEQIAANTDQAIAIAAREAELELLTLMYGATKQVKPQQYLGATRDLLASVDLLVSQYRYSHRIPRTASFTAVFPDWAKDVVRADIAREVAHDNAGPANVLAISDAQIDAWFSTRGVNVIWTLDGLKAGTYGTGGSAITNQFFGLLGGSAPEPQWPGQSTDAAFMLAWLLYPEGTYQFLDGGRLDLGVVRDSTLDATNDYETFVETFESVAMRGLEAYQVQSTILPNGGSAGTVAASGYHE